jgi:type II secretory ATPase GspE/PulE/Tfp pilus assembly ATPase PilB-like protein
MGVEPYLAASSIVGVLAQRLVRTNCSNCSAPHKERPELLAAIGINPGDYDANNPPFRAGKGCEKCNNTGFKGRRGLYELMSVDEPVRRMTVDRSAASSIKDHALTAQNMRTLLGEGRLAVLEGITTCEEVLRVCQREDI